MFRPTAGRRTERLDAAMLAVAEAQPRRLAKGGVAPRTICRPAHAVQEFLELESFFGLKHRDDESFRLLSDAALRDKISLSR